MMITAVAPSTLSALASKTFQRLLNLTLDKDFKVYSLYCIDCQDELPPEDLMKLYQLLEGQDGLTPYQEPSHPLAGLIIVPRIGTQSSWSSKATDIVHNAGLKQIERIEKGVFYHFFEPLTLDQWQTAKSLLSDRMTDTCLNADHTLKHLTALFNHNTPQPLAYIPLDTGISALEAANQRLSLGLSTVEIEYLYEQYQLLNQTPTDAELTMFAQANSEHCRHKIFNAHWQIDGKSMPHTLFGMIKNTHQQTPEGTLSAYHDNSAVIQGALTEILQPDQNGRYICHAENQHITIKVETHNHPTAISPFPGAATGAGGEIRDAGATGIGAKPKAGFSGFCVSNLALEGLRYWQPPAAYGKPDNIVSATQIMLEGPLGGAAFNDEFGRPVLGGYFRSFELSVDGEQRGYHKPIMLSGGIGTIFNAHLHKKSIPAGALLIVLGGPALNIGLGGGAASSQDSGTNSAALDFASVQRGNPEIERRAQEVLNTLIALGDDNPILSLHDVGAGGLSNALPELLNDAGVGGIIQLRDIPNAEPSMTPREIWSNEAQERYVLALHPDDLATFSHICQRERCPFAVVGVATDEKILRVYDKYFDNDIVNLPMNVLLGKLPALQKKVVTRHTTKHQRVATSLDTDALAVAIHAVLEHPTVADKTFLVTIGDRFVGGLTARDQMVGPLQVPVADCAVTTAGFYDTTGEAFAIGERPPLALISPEASVRMSIGEAITNIAAARIDALSQVKLSANWMAACQHEGEEAALYAAVEAVGMHFCPALGVSIPVGKDSLSMKTRWQDAGIEKSVTAPLSMVTSAFAPVIDVEKTLTPLLDTENAGSLWLIDLGAGQNRLGGSIYALVQHQLGNDCPDVDNPQLLKNFFHAIQSLNAHGWITAYHDRSDGGLLATLCEMMFASTSGISVNLETLGQQPVAALFNEELGAVIQIPTMHEAAAQQLLADLGLSSMTKRIGQCVSDDQLSLYQGSQLLFQASRVTLRASWSNVSHLMQQMRDHPEAAASAYASATDPNERGLAARLTFDVNTFNMHPALSASMINSGRPKVAILREQGVNSHVEAAFCFTSAGFETVDVHMSDLLAGRHHLKDFQGLVACGGFSYGDVLGAGLGWAKNILFNDHLREQFADFFAHPEKFALGICNGCQMLAALKTLIPGAETWPKFVLNASERFECRLAQVRINPSPSIFLKDMADSQLPIVVAHGEGYALGAAAIANSPLVALQFVNHAGEVTTQYPHNPNGSPYGITGVSNADGRILALMPHPERTARLLNFSWRPKSWQGQSPWMQLFHNAYRFTQ